MHPPPPKHVCHALIHPGLGSLRVFSAAVPAGKSCRPATHASSVLSAAVPAGKSGRPATHSSSRPPPRGGGLRAPADAPEVGGFVKNMLSQGDFKSPGLLHPLITSPQHFVSPHAHKPSPPPFSLCVTLVPYRKTVLEEHSYAGTLL